MIYKSVCKSVQESSVQVVCKCVQPLVTGYR